MRMLATALTVLALAASGCSGDDTGPEATTTTESSPTETSPTETSAPPATDETEQPAVQPSADDPCTLVAVEEINAAYGSLVGPGERGRGSHTEDGVGFTSTDCEWEEADSLELQLAVSTADDFGGTLACTPVSYLGDDGARVKVPGARSATWLASQDPDEVEARLRVCTDEATLNLELDAGLGTSVQVLRTQTIKLAAIAVAALGS